MNNLQTLVPNPFFMGCLAVISAYLISIRLFPVIIYLGRERNLMDEPKDRSVHFNKTPTLGGVGIFITFALSIILFSIFLRLPQPDLIRLLSLLGGTIMLLFLGIKDDLLTLSPRKKFIGQIISSALVIYFTDVRIFDFNGLFGISELPYMVSLLFTVLVFIFIINAYNLIDGIDGLAGSIAIISSLSFGVFFLLNDQILLVLISCILTGALVGFLKYNLSVSNRLFMGDSGSLFLGFLLAYQAISFLGINGDEASKFTIPNGPILAMAILAIPILDTLRVFTVRIVQGKSPFSPDRNHIHHLLLDSGLNHWQATTLVSVLNIIIIELAVCMSGLYINVQFYILGIITPFVVLISLFIIRRGSLSQNSAPNGEQQVLTGEHAINFADFLQKSVSHSFENRTSLKIAKTDIEEKERSSREFKHQEILEVENSTNPQ